MFFGFDLLVERQMSIDFCGNEMERLNTRLKVLSINVDLIKLFYGNESHKWFKIEN
jgi:hypothetical protein